MPQWLKMNSFKKLNLNIWKKLQKEIVKMQKLILNLEIKMRKMLNLVKNINN